MGPRLTELTESMASLEEMGALEVMDRLEESQVMEGLTFVN